MLADPKADMLGEREVIFHLPTFFGKKLFAQGSLGNLLLSL